MTIDDRMMEKPGNTVEMTLSIRYVFDVSLLRFPAHLIHPVTIKTNEIKDKMASGTKTANPILPSLEASD